MKQDWTVEGTVWLAGGGTKEVYQTWEGVGLARADDMLEQLAHDYILKPNVKAVDFKATALGEEGTSILVRQQWK